MNLQTRAPKLRAAVAILDEIDKLETKLNRMFDGAAPKAAKSNGHSNGAKAKKSAPADGRALQGKYLGAVRHLPKKDRLKVKKVRQDSGVHAAIKFAHSLQKGA